MRADAELLPRLAAVLGGGERAGAAVPDQPDADATLARVVWSRLVEPGDAVAGALLAALGAGPLLDLVASGASAARVCAAAHETKAGAWGAEDGAAAERRVAAGLRRWRPRLDRAASLGDLERAAATGMRLLLPEGPGWPERLRDLGDHAPVLLWVRGDPAHLSARSLAVVGARACTGYGAQVTAELTDAACGSGAAVVSGAAYGVDAVAHRTALAAGTPTVAVLAGGADRAYPSSHGPLLERIAAAGAVCSEMVPGAAPTRWRFLQRNRVIAALAEATLVTEAGTRSGSLNTAGHAAEMGRPLGAVPGPVTSAASAGCHRLLREYGATLVATADHVRELLGAEALPGDHGSGMRSAGDRQPAPHRRVLDALPLRGSREVGEVVRLSGVDPDEVPGILAELELLGQVRRDETPGRSATRWALERRE